MSATWNDHRLNSKYHPLKPPLRPPDVMLQGYFNGGRHTFRSHHPRLPSWDILFKKYRIFAHNSHNCFFADILPVGYYFFWRFYALFLQEGEGFHGLRGESPPFPPHAHLCQRPRLYPNIRILLLFSPPSSTSLSQNPAMATPAATFPPA